MAELIDLSELQEKVILVVVSTTEEEDTPASLDGLEELASTAGVVTVARIIQSREKVHLGTYLGKGKIDKVRELLWDTRATGVVCDDELSPAQLRNLGDALDTKVIDRTMVILDIFAPRASTREGKIQVELAQLKYRAVRPVGMRNSLSRLGGGTGTKGPGEKKLEADRRLIHQQIGQLKEELANVKRHREVTRQQREKNSALSVAVVGYTNAGKSILLNRLIGAEILAEDKLFATLDPTTRNYTLEDGQQMLLTDAVEFVRKLLHHLIKAFKSILEETYYSDIVLHVVDCSNPQMDMQMHVVEETLKELEIVGKTMVIVLNEVDRFREPEAMGDGSVIQIPRDFSLDYQVRISARTGEGVGELQKVLQVIIRSRRILPEKVFPYSRAGCTQTIRRYGQLLEEEYQEDRIAVKTYVPAELFGKLYSD